ncbi:MAG: tail fiber domain-containing protein, partial [Allorhizobium sp.]
MTELPELIYYFTVTGGTANAIVATPNATPPTSPGAALLTMTATAVNTGAVTLNGKPLRANGGEELQAGEVHAGDLLAFLNLGSEYRLITDPGSLRNKIAAMEWATRPEDDPVGLEAGGDGSTTFSAKHWAAKSDEQADRSEMARAGSEAARNIAAGYASDAVSQGNVPIYATAVGLSGLTIPDGINFIRTNGYYAANGRGAAIYRLMLALEAVEPGELLSNTGTKRWGLAAGQDIHVEMFGATPGLSKAHTSINDAAFDAADLFMAMRGGGTVFTPAHFYCLTKLRFSPGVYFKGSGHGKWMPSFPNQMKTWEGTNLVAVQADKDYEVRGITSMRYAGGWREDPDSPGRYIKLTSFMDDDASGTAAATPRPMQVFIANREQGKDKGGISDCRIVPWIGADGVSDYSDTANTSLGDDVDVGLMLNTMEGGRFSNVQIRGSWRMAGRAVISPDFSDYGRVENNVFMNVSSQGYVGTLIRGGDTWRVLSKTANSVTIRWSEESYWPTSGQFEALNVGYVAYTGLVRDGDNLTFTGTDKDVSAASIVRAPYRGIGFSTTRHIGCENWGLWHHSGLKAEALGFTGPSKGLEVSGFPLRGVHWIDDSTFGEASNSCCVFFHECHDATFLGGKWEIGHALASPFTSLSTAVAPSGNTQNISLLGLYWSSSIDRRLFTPRSMSDLQSQINPASRLSSHLLIEALTGQDWMARLATGRNFQLLKSDGSIAIVTFDSGNTEVRGSLTVGATGGQAFINSQAGQPMNLRIGTTSRMQITADGHWHPGGDGTQNVGTGALRMGTIFAATGAINTSDEREKQKVAAIREAILSAWADVDWCEFVFNGAVDVKGDGARVHFGLIAQQVQRAFQAHGLEGHDFALFCYDEWEDQYEEELEEVRTTQLVLDEEGNVIDEVENIDLVPRGRM